MENVEDGAWIAALAAPWAIAPHPNFSQGTITGPGLLALVTLFRSLDLERYSEFAGDDVNPLVSALIDAASRSTTEGTVRSGREDLWKIAQNRKSSTGMRVAATILATVADVELDEIAPVVGKIEAIVTELVEIDQTRSGRLAIALLQQQSAARKFELFDYAGAFQVLDSIPKLIATFGPWDEFPVSPGIGWNSQKIQDDVQAALIQHGMELRARMEGFEGSKWVEVVRSRPNWPDYKGAISAASADRKLVDLHFEKSIGLTNRRMTWSANDPVISPALESLMVAELSGDVNAYMIARRTLAQLRVLHANDNPSEQNDWYVGEALRLFRQSRSKAELDRTLDWIYLQGPSQALKNDADLILNRIDFPRRVTATDLSVLSSAAPYLSPPKLAKALSSALHFLDSPKGPPGSAPADERTAWKAISRLLPDSGMDEMVAESALRVIASSSYLDLVETDLLRLLDSLDWEKVSPLVVEGWRNWGRTLTGTTAPAELARRASRVHSEVSDEPSIADADGIDLAVKLVANHGNPSSIPDSALLRAERSCMESLAAISNNARRGSFSFGGIDTADLSTLFAKVFNREALWISVAEFLTEPAVTRTQKERSLHRIASYGESVVPEPAQCLIRNNWISVVATRPLEPFNDSLPDTTFPAALRVGVVLRILSRDEAIEAVAQITGSKSSDERTAACTLLLDIAETYSEWVLAQTMLLSLVSDPSPEVRSEAAKSLAVAGKHTTAVSTLVRRTLSSALQSDGLRTPLLTIHGFQKLAAAGELDSYDDEILTMLRLLSENHEASTIRKAASLVFSPDFDVPQS